MTHPPLLLTGGPAAGKTTTALRLASTTPRAAFLDVDDIRQLVRNGGAAPWDGPEGMAQQRLGILNAATLARNFAEEGFAVTIADVVTASTLRQYRALLPGVVVIRLDLTLAEARRRAGLRPVHLTDAEFDELHRRQTEPLAVDHELDVTRMGLDEQVEAVRRLWGRQPEQRREAQSPRH